ncbi:hypothetical protein M426DRAFT_263204 [Hypoxylon sp. CI-4A]|nr:hypothetical protein M426DRAFT_263204 [Hypoxylon sp. CI-4A]
MFPRTSFVSRDGPSGVLRRGTHGLNRPALPPRFGRDQGYLYVDHGNLSLVDESGSMVTDELRSLPDGGMAAMVIGNQRARGTLQALESYTASLPQNDRQAYMVGLIPVDSGAQHASGAPSRNQRRNRNRHNPTSTQNRPGNASRATRPEQQHALVCGYCEQPGHEIRTCVRKWTPSGDIPGCYRCNRLSHTIDTCRIEPRLGDDARYDFEVRGRSGQPPLRSTRGWNQLAIAANHQTAGPISRERMITVPPGHFSRWDYTRDKREQLNLLILDPATENLDKIRVLPDQGYRAPTSARPNMRGRNVIDNRAANQAAALASSVPTASVPASTAASASIAASTLPSAFAPSLTPGLAPNISMAPATAPVSMASVSTPAPTAPVTTPSMAPAKTVDGPTPEPVDTTMGEADGERKETWDEEMERHDEELREQEQRGQN